MEWNIPGTTLTGQREEADRIGEQFQALFLAGGLSLSQVSAITGLEPYTVQNWVKRRLLPPPESKKYTLEQLCRLVNLNLLRGTVNLDQMAQLMGYLNGDLADESDDLVDDTALYFFFVRLAARAEGTDCPENWQAALTEVTKDYVEPLPGARQKLVKVLEVMLTVWCANCLKTRAEAMIAEL